MAEQKPISFEDLLAMAVLVPYALIAKSDHGKLGNRLRRTRKAIGKIKLRTFIDLSPKSLFSGMIASAGSEGYFFKLLSASGEAGFRVLRGENSEAPRRHAVKNETLGKGIENVV